MRHISIQYRERLWTARHPSSHTSPSPSCPSLPMTKAAPSRHAFQPLLRALKSGLPRLLIETGQEPLVLCFRRQGELIHDPECAQHFKATEDGVFRRCEILQGGAQGFLWTYYFSAQPIAFPAQARPCSFLARAMEQASARCSLANRTPYRHRRPQRSQQLSANAHANGDPPPAKSRPLQAAVFERSILAEIAFKMPVDPTRQALPTAITWNARPCARHRSGRYLAGTQAKASPLP